MVLSGHMWGAQPMGRCKDVGSLLRKHQQRPVRSDCVPGTQSSPSRSTTQFTVCEEFLQVVTKARNWRGFCTTMRSLRPPICGSGDVLAGLSLARKFRFPATETDVSRDLVRMVGYCAGSPSIWCCRDHSAGRSTRRTTPMPCGSRPSIAAPGHSPMSRSETGRGARGTSLLGRSFLEPAGHPASARGLQCRSLRNACN